MKFSFLAIFEGGGWHMKTCDSRLLRPERSSAARRCACFYLLISGYVCQSGHNVYTQTFFDIESFVPILQRIVTILAMFLQKETREQKLCLCIGTFKKILIHFESP